MRKRMFVLAIAAVALTLTAPAKDFVSALDHSSFLEMVTLGKVSDAYRVQKFGYNGAVGTSLVPLASEGVYACPTNLVALEIVSSSALDVSTTNGAHKVVIQGLSTNWTEVSETVTLNGTTAVDLANSYYRIYRAYVSESGSYADASTPSHAGTLTIRVDGGGATWATITDDDGGGFFMGQTQIGCYTVPDGYTAYIPFKHFSIESTKVVDLVMFQRPNCDDVTSPYTGTLRVIEQHKGVVGNTDVDLNTMLGPFVGPCDIGFMGKVAAGTAAVSVDFEILLTPTND